MSNNETLQSAAAQQTAAGMVSAQARHAPALRSVMLHQGIESLREAVATLDGNVSEPSDLLKALDPFTPVVVQELCQAYRRRHIGLLLPLSKQAESLADALISLHRTMANTYGKVYSGLIEDELFDDAMLQSALKAAHRAQTHLTQALLLTYESYRAEPKGIWREVHAIHQQALSAGIEKHPIPDTQALTLEKAYKHALLLGLSNPYHLPFGVIYKIERALGRWREKASLSSSLPRDGGRCVFLVDADLDIPAIPLLSNCAKPKFGNHLFLETRDLAAELQQQMRIARDEPDADQSGHIKRLSRIEALKTLRALIKRWGSHQIRAAQRIVRHGPCDLAVGTVSVVHALRDPLRNQVEEPTNIVLSEDIEHTGFSQWMAWHRNVIHVSPNWRIRDSSPQGLRLTFTSCHESRIQVNELVAVKPRDRDEPWLTGLVQWARVDGSRTLEIGVRGLTRHARPVSITAYRTWKEGKPVCIPALLLPPDRECPASESLVIPRTELFDTAVRLVTCLDEDEWTVKLKALISAAPSFYRYEIASRTRADRDSATQTGHPDMRVAGNVAGTGHPH